MRLIDFELGGADPMAVTQKQNIAVIACIGSGKTSNNCASSGGDDGGAVAAVQRICMEK